MLLVCNAAALLTAAYGHVWNLLCTAGTHISCPSYGLNGVGKAMVAEVPSCITTGKMRPVPCVSEHFRTFLNGRASKF